MFRIGDLVYFNNEQLAKRHINFRKDVKRGKYVGFIIINVKDNNTFYLAKVMWNEEKNTINCVINNQTYWIKYMHLFSAKENELDLSTYKINDSENLAREAFSKYKKNIELANKKGIEKRLQKENELKEKLSSMTYEERQEYFKNEKLRKIQHKKKLKKARAARRKYSNNNHGIQSCTNYDQSKIYGKIKIVRG